MASNIEIKNFDDYIFENFLSSNNGKLLNCNFSDIDIYSSNYQIINNNSNNYFDILEKNYINNSNSIYDLYTYCNLSNNNELSNYVFSNLYFIDDEGLLVYTSNNDIKKYDLSSNATGYNFQNNTIDNDSYYDYKIRYDYFKDVLTYVESKNFKAIDTDNEVFNLTQTSNKLTIINTNIKDIITEVNKNTNLIINAKVFINSLKYYYYITLLVITHYIISNFKNIQTNNNLLDDFNNKLSTIINNISNFNVDITDSIKTEIEENDDKYKKNMDKYTTKNNQLNNLVKSNLYNNIFIYITIVIIILICLGIIYINNHKGSLKTQYSIAVITFLLLYYIVYTNISIDIENFKDASDNKTSLDTLMRKVISYLEIIKNDKPYIKSVLEKEKNKYSNYAKSSKSKVNSLELVLNDEFINAIKSKELVKFLILFTTICIVCFIIQTNVEDLTTTSIIFIILFIIILGIYFYNINLMTRTKHETKYWNHRMSMK